MASTAEFEIRTWTDALAVYTLVFYEMRQIPMVRSKNVAQTFPE